MVEKVFQRPPKLRSFLPLTVLYIASDQLGAGKTALCAAIASELKRQGKRALVFKPLARSDDPDPAVYLSLLGQPETDSPFQLSTGGLTGTLLGSIVEASEKAMQGQDVLIVEGTAGLSPEDATRLVDGLDARILVVAKYGPALEAAHLTGWREQFGERLLGFLINSLTRFKGNDTRTRLLPSMASEGLSCKGVIPEDRRLLGVTVDQLASHLDGRLLGGEDVGDGLVEHFVVGGMGMDPGELYFDLWRNKAVIVRGDRPDIHMAALATPTTCMLLTRGIEPIEYVTYEAEQAEVPLVVVPSDTLATMAALGSLLDAPRFDHPSKLERFVELLREHADLPAVYSGLSLTF